MAVTNLLMNEHQIVHTSLSYLCLALCLDLDLVPSLSLFLCLALALLLGSFVVSPLPPGR